MPNSESLKENQRTPTTSVTQLLHHWQNGQQLALNQLIDTAYERLQNIGRRLIRNENRFQTLQTQALIHEAYIRFLDLDKLQWRDREHFFSVWTGIMRRILIDHARAGTAAKRGGNEKAITYDDSVIASGTEFEITDLCDALKRLGEQAESQRKIVELRYFSGLSIEEVALILNMSPATVKRKWSLAQAWLFRDLSESTC